MNIGQAAEASGLSPKAIRYYETQGLVVPVRAQGNGYRDYSFDDIKRLVFLRGARAAGFGVDECRELLMLYANPGRSSAELKGNLLEKMGRLDEQMAALASMRATLEAMIGECTVPDGQKTPQSDETAREFQLSESQSAVKAIGLTFTLLGEANGS